MPKAGYCEACGANVWLAEDGSCHRGHEPSSISNVYEAEVPADGFQEAADAIDDAASQAGAALKSAWDDASPAAQDAAEQAGLAARKAADAAAAFGKRLFSSDDQDATSAPSRTDPNDDTD